jgi:Tuberculosis necrotizing toxin
MNGFYRSVASTFGVATGAYLSSQGVNSRARSMPYACTQIHYRISRLQKPLAARTRHVAACFGEPGGNIMYKTDDPAGSRFRDGVRAVILTYRALATNHLDHASK